jgi:hypothetical protein
MKADLRSLLETVREEPGQLGAAPVPGLALSRILDGCIRGSHRDGLPGEARQPERGRVGADMAEESVVPAFGQAVGVNWAICCRVTIESLHWLAYSCPDEYWAKEGNPDDRA